MCNKSYLVSQHKGTVILRKDSFLAKFVSWKPLEFSEDLATMANKIPETVSTYFESDSDIQPLKVRLLRRQNQVRQCENCSQFNGTK